MYKTGSDHGGVLLIFVSNYVKGKGGKDALFWLPSNYFHIYSPLSHTPPKTVEISMDSKFYIFNISRYHSVLKNLKIVFRNSETSIPLT